jgi:cyclitol reductase
MSSAGGPPNETAPTFSYRRLERLQTAVRVVTVDAVDRGYESMLMVEPFAVGVCRSDIRELQKRRWGRSDFGHEVVGRVMWSRGGHYAKDDLVVLDPHVDLGYRSTAFGTLMEVHGSRSAVEAAVIRFEPGAWAPLGFFVEPLACVVHCSRIIVTVLRDSLRSVQVVGAGMAGVLLSAVFAMSGVRVWLTNRSPDRWELLRTAGLFDLGDIQLEPDDQPVDAIVVATTEFRQGVDMMGRLRSDGLLVPYGAAAPNESWNSVAIGEVRRTQGLVRTRSGVIQGTHGARYEDFEFARDVLESSLAFRRVLENLITHRRGLWDLPQLLLRMAAGLRVGKAVVSYP